MSKIDRAAIRHNCSTAGCYLERAHPPVHLLANALPRDIRFSDIDAVVEINGEVLFLEWKEGIRAELPLGQRILAQRLTALSPRITYGAVFWEEHSTDVRAMTVARGGHFGATEEYDIERLNERIASWAARADMRKAA